MDWQPEEPDNGPDPLDRLLADARWAEPAPEAVHRLRGQWRSLMSRRARRRRRLFALATAGSLLAVGLGLWQLLSGTLRPTRENDIVAPSPLQAQKPLTPKTESSLAVKRPPASPRTPAPRTPSPRTPGPRSCASNAYEQVMITIHRRVVHQHRRDTAVAQPADAAVEQEQPAARSVEPNVREVAEATNSPSLGQLAARQQDPAVRKEMLSVLFARGDRASVDVFLTRVRDPKTSADALACVANMPNPPLQTLFQCLHSPQAARRIAAAQVLGRLNQPAVSRELIAMVARGTLRQEAMIALLSSSEATAQQFITDARQNPMLSATLWNAERVFQTSSSWRS
jgi:hypothetical protein